MRYCIRATVTKESVSRLMFVQLMRSVPPLLYILATHKLTQTGKFISTHFDSVSTLTASPYGPGGVLVHQFYLINIVTIGTTVF